MPKCQCHSDLETVGDSPGPKMYLHTKYELTPEIKVTVAENSERHPMTPT